MKYLWLVPVFLLLLVGFAHAANSHYATFNSTANQYLSASDSSSLSPTGALSLQFAIKLAGTPADAQGVFGVYNAGSQSYMIQRDGDNRLRFIIYNSSGARTDFTMTSALSTGTWYCVMGTFNPSTRFEWLVSSGCTGGYSTDLTTTTSIPANIKDGTGGFYIGAFGAYVGTAANNLNGSIDDIRVWSEVHNGASDYNCQIAGSETNLNAYWKLNNALTDSTSNANNLTNTGSTPFNTTSLPFSGDCGGGGGGGAAPRFGDIIIFE